MKTALTNVNVISMRSEDILKNVTVVVEGNKITQIGCFAPGASADRVIDCQGGFLLPGLTDMHVHLGKHSEKSYDAFTKAFLARGVTQVRNMNGCHEVLSLRDRIEEGAVEGIHINSVCPIIESAPLTSTIHVCVDHPDQADDHVCLMKDVGYDAIKVYNNVKPEVFDALLDACKRYDMRLCGHVPIPIGAKRCIETAFDSIEHVRAFPRELLAPAGQAHKHWTPTLVIEKLDYKHEEINRAMSSKALHNHINMNLYNSWAAEMDYLRTVDFRADRTYEEYVAGISTFVENGGVLLAGTDTGLPLMIPGLALYDELYELTTAGLSAYEALRTATVSAADYLGLSDKRGTIEPGKDADLVLFRENPLANIQNLYTTQCVMFQGKWYDEQDRDRLLQEAASSRFDSPAYADKRKGV